MSGIDSCEISREMVETILRGSFSDIVRDAQGRTGDDLDPLIQEFYWEVIGRGLCPRVVVDYDTKPYHSQAKVLSKRFVQLLSVLNHHSLQSF